MKLHNKTGTQLKPAHIQYKTMRIRIHKKSKKKKKQKITKTYNYTEFDGCISNYAIHLIFNEQCKSVMD